MIHIPFAKAHGAKNDFLLTWVHEAPAAALQSKAAIALCDRHTGAGADGWLLVTPPAGGRPAAIRLFNSDGSEAEMSGNGTRCAAAFLCDAGIAGPEIEIATGAGLKRLTLISRRQLQFEFEMIMGNAVIDPGNLHASLDLASGPRECTILSAGNPQCALFTDEFPAGWQALGAEIERHPRFPNRTNVSFVRTLGRHDLDVRFFERGAGFTLSSGTGSTGAFAAALARGLVDSPVTVHTLAGPLDFRMEQGEIRMRGPAEIVAGGEFYFCPPSSDQR